MSKARALVLALVLAGCSGRDIAVEVVVVHCEPRGGSPDCVTVVHGPDDYRYNRGGKWGEVGDSFSIHLDSTGRWTR